MTATVGTEGRCGGRGRPSPRAVTLVLSTTLLLLSTGGAAANPPVLNGHVEYETHGYPDSQTAGERWDNFFVATLRGNGQFTPTLTWQFEGRAVADDIAYTAGAYSLRNEERRRPYLSLITAVLDYRPSPDLRVSVGKQINNWSIFDEIQPANLMTPSDESEGYRRVELGVPGVSVHYSSGDAFAELVVVPLAFTPSRLPQGRWNILRGKDAVERQDLPPVRFDETQAGARIGMHLGQLEASILGYVGRDTSAEFVAGPIIVTTVDGRPHFTAQIIDHFPRLNAGGVTASYPLGDRLLLRTEAVYYNSCDCTRADFVHCLGGMEYALDDWRLVLNYLRDDQTVAAHQEVVNKGELRFFQSFLFGEARYDAGGRLRGRVRGGYDFNGEFALAQPEVSYRLWQTLWVTLFGGVTGVGKSSYTNNKTSYFTTIRHEDRLGTRIEYDF